MSRALVALTAVLVVGACQWQWIEPPVPPVTIVPRIAPPTATVESLVPTVTPDVRTPTKEAE